MGQLSLAEYLNIAREEGRAIGHFNFAELSQLNGIIDAVRELGVPVLLGTSEGERKFVGMAQAVVLIRSFREEGLAVFLNADHCKSVESAKEAVDAGYDSVHIDLSKESFENNLRGTKDYPLENLKEFLKGKKGYKIDLMGAEPAMRKDLAEIIRTVRKSGNIAALHTNGIKISDYNYLKELKESGLNEVHFQFDGFDDDVYEILRGEKLLETKLKALENLERLNIATDLVATIARGLNEKEMKKILDFGIGHSFVKEIFFLGCRFLGKAKDLPVERCMMPDELIDVLEEETNGAISRQNIFRFQKLYFALLSAFSIRKCFYIQHFLMVRRRGKEGYIPIDKIFDLESIQRNLERFKELKSRGSKLALPYLLSSLALKVTSFRNLLWLKEFLAFAPPFIRGFDLSKLPQRGVLLGFISACDAYSLDYQIAQNCDKGAISCELGVQDTGAIDNVLRDRLMKV